MSTKRTTKTAKSQAKGMKKATAKKVKTEPGKLSALNAAAKVLSESAEPMNAKSLIEAMATKGYWTSPGGQTPHATLFAAITRAIKVKGAESRFAKVDRGQFTLNGGKTVKPAKRGKKSQAEGDSAAETPAE